MNVLKGLIRLLNKHRTYYRDNIGLPTNKDAKLYKLANGLRDGTYKDEDNAAQDIYGTDANHINFTRLKYRLQNRLFHGLLLIDPEKIFSSKVDRDYFMVNQYNTICAILSYLKENKLAYHLAKLSLPKAKSSFNPYAGLNLSLLLRTLAKNSGKRKESEYYLTQIKYFQEYINIEVKLNLMYYEYKDLEARPKTEIDQIKEMMDGFLLELEKTKIDYSARTIFYAYNLYLHDRLIYRDIPGILKCCEDGLKLMKPYNRPDLEILFYLAMLEAHGFKKEFEPAKKIIFYCLNELTLSITNRLSLIRSYADLCIGTENYQDLGDALKLHIENKVEKSPIAFFKENFTILEMIYYILVTLEKIKPTYPVKSKIRISKFINDLPLFSKEKKGVNTLILFVQLLLLIIKHDYGSIIDRVESLKAYDQKYLKKADSFRITCFLKMTLLIPKHNFHPVAVQRHAAPYLKKLEDSKDQDLNWKDTNYEIIPYENFWKLFIEALERNRKVK